MKLRLKTLSPVHVGSGDKLYALDYVIDNRTKTYYRVSQNQFLKFLTQQEDNEKLLKNYASWISETEKKISELKSEKGQAKKYQQNDLVKDLQQQLSEVQNAFNLYSFCKIENLDEHFIQFLDANTQIVKIPYSKHPKHQIRPLISISNNHYYLPGTSIKGSIRTALLYRFLEDRVSVEQVRRLLSKKVETAESKIKNICSEYEPKVRIERSHKKKRELIREWQGKENDVLAEYLSNLGDDLEQLCFYASKKGNLDEKFDLMKLLSISDGIIEKNTNILGIGRVDLYVISHQLSQEGRKKKKQGQEIDNKEDTEKGSALQRQTPSVEYLKENVYIESNINFDIDFILTLKKQRNTEGKIVIKNKDGEEEELWISFGKKVKDLFNLDIESLSDTNKEKKKIEVIDYILDCICKFSTDQKNATDKWLKKFINTSPAHNYQYKDKDVEKIQKGLSRIKTKDCIRIGYGSGFDGITEFMYFSKHKDLRSLFEKMLDTDLVLNGGFYLDENYSLDIREFPKSRRMVTERDIIKPLGWLEIVDERIEARKRQKAEEAKKQAEEKERQRLKELEEEWKNEPRPFGGELKTGVVLEAKIVDIQTAFAFAVYSPKIGKFSQRYALEIGKKGKKDARYQIGSLLKVSCQVTKKGHVSFMFKEFVRKD